MTCADDRFITTNGRLVTKLLFPRALAVIKAHSGFSSPVKATSEL